MLLLAEIAESAGQRPSKLAGLHEVYGESDPGLLDFDFACALRLKIQRNKERANLAKLIAAEVSMIFATKEEREQYAAKQMTKEEPLSEDDYL